MSRPGSNSSSDVSDPGFKSKSYIVGSVDWNVTGEEPGSFLGGDGGKGSSVLVSDKVVVAFSLHVVSHPVAFEALVADLLA